MILYSSMSSFFNREDRLDREFAYFREKREENEILKEENNNLKKENEILKEENNNLKKENEILKTENKELQEKLNNCSHFKSQLKWYENFFEEALMKYMHDYDFIIKNKHIVNSSFSDIDSEVSLLDEKMKYKERRKEYQREYLRNNPEQKEKNKKRVLSRYHTLKKK